MSNFVRMFQPRFAPLVGSGKKRQTIRKTPKRMPKPGDVISCREWTGKAYRSTQWEIWRAEITEVSRVLVSRNGVTIEGRDSWDLNRFAVHDGFADWEDLTEWFENTHALPFEGILIKWGENQMPKGRTDQEIFDRVAEHLLKQGERSAAGVCMYRSPTGLKCAVGCLIPDSRYSLELEELGVTREPVWEVMKELGYKESQVSLLSELQWIHDGGDPDEWSKLLRFAAQKFELEVPKCLH